MHRTTETARHATPKLQDSPRSTRRFLGVGVSLALGLVATFQLHHGHVAAPPARAEAAAATSPLTVSNRPALASERLPRASRHRLPAGKPLGAMPVGSLPGWRQVLAEDFTGPRLPAGWVRYAGRPGGNSHGWWDISHTVVRGKDLHLVGDWRHGTFVTGGVMASRWSSSYGKYQVRFKVSRAPGVSYALLLWPTNDNWPSGGEIDFAEDGGGPRHITTATLHYGRSNRQIQRRVRADITQFQTVGVEWVPGRIVYTLNGRPWATVTGAHVPTGPMRLALQLEAGRGTNWSQAPSRATPRTVDMVIDWVVGYRRA
jgi:hypothetical protein